MDVLVNLGILSHFVNMYEVIRLYSLSTILFVNYTLKLEFFKKVKEGRENLVKSCWLFIIMYYFSSICVYQLNFSFLTSIAIFKKLK